MERSISIGPVQPPTSKGGPTFSKFFRLDPFSFNPKFLVILVEWIAPNHRVKSGKIRGESSSQSLSPMHVVFPREAKGNLVPRVLSLPGNEVGQREAGCVCSRTQPATSGARAGISRSASPFKVAQ